MRLALCSDLHLDIVGDIGIKSFASTVRATSADMLVIAGDISQGDKLVSHLQKLADYTEIPISFVLGNHDYWRSSFHELEQRVIELCARDSRLKWLKKMSVQLSPDTVLIGTDGWYDMMHGSLASSNFFMNDWRLIGEFVNAVSMRALHPLSHPAFNEYITISRRHASSDVAELEQRIDAASARYKNVIIVTHVPPWPEVSRYRGLPSSQGSLPFYTSKLMGDMLNSKFQLSVGERTLNVFCGHTHDRAEHFFTKNIVARCMPAEYGYPRIADLVGVK